MAPRDRSDGGADEADVPFFSRCSDDSLWSIVCLQSHVTYLFQDSGTTVWSRIRKRVGVELVKDVMMR
jgi:hypothetical protein